MTVLVICLRVGYFDYFRLRKKVPISTRQDHPICNHAMVHGGERRGVSAKTISEDTKPGVSIYLNFVGTYLNTLWFDLWDAL